MADTKTVIVAVVSDLHVNSTVGLSPPYTALDGGQVMRHSVLLDRPARSWGYRLRVQDTQAKEANND